MMQRYVLIDSDGYVVNVVLWDGKSSYNVGNGYRLELESETSAVARPIIEVDPDL